MPLSSGPDDGLDASADVPSDGPAESGHELPEPRLDPMIEEILERFGPNGDPDLVVRMKPDPKNPRVTEHPPLAVPGMMDEPLRLLDEALKNAEKNLPELAQSILMLSRTQQTAPAPEVPGDFERQLTAISDIENKVSNVIAEFAKVGEELITVFRNAQNTARYMADEGADPNLPWWKKTLNTMVPYGGTKRVVNSAVGATSFLATVGGSAWVVGHALADVCAPLFAAASSLGTIPVAGVVLDWAATLVISLLAVSIPTAIASIVAGGGATTLGYGGLTWAWDKTFSKQNDTVKAWIQSLNVSFSGAKDRALSGFAELEDSLRKLSELRDNIPADCVDARAACAERAKETGRDVKEWEKEDAEFVEKSSGNQRSADQEKAILKLLHMLQHLTDVVKPIDPLSDEDLLTRGFQGLGDICRVIEKIGKIHFFFPGGRPAKDNRVWRFIYDWLGVAGGPVKRFGAFMQALTTDGERPFRMLHELLGAILEQGRLKKRSGVTMTDMLSAAFDKETLEEHGWQHWAFGGAADVAFAYGLKTIPLIERANERRKFSPDSARMEVRKKIGDKTWRTQAAKSMWRKVAGIAGDVASVGASAVVGGVRRLFLSRDSRLRGDEDSAKKATITAQEELLRAFPAFAQYNALSNTQLRERIRREVKAMPPDNDVEAVRVSDFIDYWEKREEIEDLQSKQLAAGHTMQLSEIDSQLPRLLERLNGSHGFDSTKSMLEDINKNLRYETILPGSQRNGEKDTVIGSTREGALVVLGRIPTSSGTASPRTVSIIPPDLAQAFIQCHVTEKKCLPSALLSDEATVLLLAEYAVGGGPLTAAQRDALLQVQVSGDPASIGNPKLQSVFSKYQYDGFSGPDGRTIVTGFRGLFSVLRGRSTTEKRTKSRGWMGDV